MDHSPVTHVHVPPADASAAHAHAATQAHEHAHSHTNSHAHVPAVDRESAQHVPAVDFVPPPRMHMDDIPTPDYSPDYTFRQPSGHRISSSPAGNIVGTIVGVVFLFIWLSVAGFILSQAASMRHPTPNSRIWSTTPLHGTEGLLFPPGGIQVQPR